MTRKKTSAQLDREIAEELSSSTPQTRTPIAWHVRGTNLMLDPPLDTVIQRSRTLAAAEKARSRFSSKRWNRDFENVRIVEVFE